jgi:hypothetical protein
MKKIALALLLVFSSLSLAASAQEVIIRERPPHRIVEHPGPPPEHGMVWIAGYHRYDGGHYVWTPGRWDHPPHEGGVWVPHRWEHRGDHWVLIEGHWR